MAAFYAVSGGLTLDSVDCTSASASAAELEKVVRKLGTGAMPPQGLPRPDKATHDALVAWIGGELDRAAAAKPNPGRSVLRRRNRTEYLDNIREIERRIQTAEKQATASITIPE